MSIDDSNLQGQRPFDQQSADPRPALLTIPTRRNLAADVLAADVRERRAEQIDRNYVLILTMHVTELVESRLPPEETVEFLRVRRNGNCELNESRWIDLLAERTGADSPDQRAALRRSFREWQKALIEVSRAFCVRREKDMGSLLDVLDEVYRRLKPYSLSATSDTPTALPPVSPQLLLLILNAVRAASERSIPAGHTEGVKDTDVNDIETGLLELGRALQAGTETQASQTVQKDLADFLQTLLHYDLSDPSDDLALVRFGTRLLIALGGGPESFFAVFGQLNVFRTLDPVLTRDDFMSAMQRLGQLAERLAADRGVQQLVAVLNRGVAEEERLPTARRLASYCVGNQLMAALDAALSGELSADRRRELVQLAKLLADRVAQTDSQFEAIAWYRLSIGAAAAEVYQDASLFATAVERIGGLEAAVVAAARVRQHFYRPALQEAIDARLRALVLQK